MPFSIKRLTTKWNSNLNQYTSFNHNRIKLFVTTCNNRTNWNIISKWEDTPFISFLTLIEKITWMIWDPKLAKAVYKIKWLTGLHLENVRLKNTKIYDSPDTCKKGECSYFTNISLTMIYFSHQGVNVTNRLGDLCLQLLCAGAQKLMQYVRKI